MVGFGTLDSLSPNASRPLQSILPKTKSALHKRQQKLHVQSARARRVSRETVGGQLQHAVVGPKFGQDMVLDIDGLGQAVLGRAGNQVVLREYRY